MKPRLGAGLPGTFRFHLPRRSAIPPVLTAIAAVWLCSCGGDDFPLTSRSVPCIDYAGYLRRASVLPLSGGSEAVAYDGAYVYVVQDGIHDTCLSMVDVSDPAFPRVVGTAPLDGTSHNVAVADGYAYVPARHSLQILDVNDPGAPRPVAALDMSDGAFDVTLADGRAFVTHFPGGLDVVDVADPEAPAIVGHLKMDGATIGIAVAGTTAYVANGDLGLAIVDVADPAAPRLAGTVGTPGFARYVALSGSRSPTSRTTETS